MASDLIRERLLSPVGDGCLAVDGDSVAALLERVKRGAFDQIAAMEVHERALALSASPGFDQLLSVDVVRNMTPFPYQMWAVREVVQKMRGRAILADEVGLGKTIEAGLAMTEYILRGLVRRVLILCPPPLVEQWIEEMKTKFNLSFVASDEAGFVARENPWLEEERIVASLDTAKKEPHSTLLQSVPFDLVIVDEAHRCRNRSTLNWKLVNGLNKKYILLLTATPVQNDLQELFNLITLLRPGQLETAASFKRRFVTRGDKLKPKNIDELRPLMRQVMVRNRREGCGIVLPRRKAETIRLQPTYWEADFYARVTELVRQRYAQDAKRSSVRLALKTIQKEAGSSVHAVVPTLVRLRGSGFFSDCTESLSELVAMGVEIETSAKAKALMKILEAVDDKVIVFTGYTATLDYLAGCLREAGVPFATFSGELTRHQKEAAVESFRGQTRVLLSTESGGEGRNLQFCHAMVNYDLPWNPMRIEQRIGRIHRIGQEHDVHIFNLSAEGTLESHILEILDSKINMFELVVGELDMILGDIEDEEGFEDLVLDLWARAGSEGELHGRFRSLEEKLVEAKARYNRTTEYENNLFGRDLETQEGAQQDASVQLR